MITEHLEKIKSKSVGRPVVVKISIDQWQMIKTMLNESEELYWRNYLKDQVSFENYMTFKACHEKINSIRY